MAKKLTVELPVFLKTTKLDAHGSKQMTFEVSAGNSVESAKVELMSRDLIYRLPVPLILTVTEGCQDGGEKNNKKTAYKEGSNKKSKTDKGSFAG